MTFFDITPQSRGIGTSLAAWAQARMAADGLDPAGFAMTLLTFARPLTPQTGVERPAGFAHAGDRAFYPCSVVKVFYLAAAQAQLEGGKLAAHGELDRAMRDMIRWSSNMATNYIIDLVTGTTGDTLLGEAELPGMGRAPAMGQSLLPLPRLAGSRGGQRLPEAHGRRPLWPGEDLRGHGRQQPQPLSTNAAARLFHEIFAGRMVTPARSRVMAEMLARPLEDPEFVANPLSQIRGYFAAGLPSRGAGLVQGRPHRLDGRCRCQLPAP